MRRPRKHWTQNALESLLGWLPSKRYASHYRWNKVVCGIVKNEEVLLVEWLAHYHALGFDRAFVGDFGLSADARKKIQPFIDRGFLELRTCLDRDLTTHEQKKFYNRMIRELRGDARWIAFFDTDEFLGMTRPLDEVLAERDSDRSCGAVMVNWVMYGTSGVLAEPEGPDYMKTFIRRAPNTHGEHSQVKTMLRPEAVVGFYAQMHFPVMRRGRRGTFGSGKDFVWGQGHIEWEPLRLAHYWYRSEEFYRNVKIPRRLALMGDDRSEARWKGHYELCNQVEDTFMHRYVEPMRSALRQFGVDQG